MCRIYKIPDGKPENAFAFSGEAKNKKYATEIIHECHEAWRRLISGESPARTPTYDLSMYVPTCFFCLSSIVCRREIILTDSLHFSANVTLPRSLGYVTKDDPAYANLPHDSRMPPAPIEPSGELSISPRVYGLHPDFVIPSQCRNGSTSLPYISSALCCVINLREM